MNNKNNNNLAFIPQKNIELSDVAQETERQKRGVQEKGE